MKKSEKPTKYAMTSKFANIYDGQEVLGYIGLAIQIWKRYPVDMLVFKNGSLQTMKIMAHGYHVDTQAFINREILCIDFLPIKKFWLKYDEQDDYWLGTFLLPEEY